MAPKRLKVLEIKALVKSAHTSNGCMKRKLLYTGFCKIKTLQLTSQGLSQCHSGKIAGEKIKNFICSAWELLEIIPQEVHRTKILGSVPMDMCTH